MPEWARRLPAFRRAELDNLQSILTARRSSATMEWRAVSTRIIPHCTSQDWDGVKKMYTTGTVRADAPWRACLLAIGLGVEAAPSGIGAYLKRNRFWNRLYKDALPSAEDRKVRSAAGCERYVVRLCELFQADGLWCRRMVQLPQKMLPWMVQCSVRWYAEKSPGWLQLTFGPDAPTTELALQLDGKPAQPLRWWMHEMHAAGPFLVDLLKGCRKLGDV